MITLHFTSKHSSIAFIRAEGEKILIYREMGEKLAKILPSSPRSRQYNNINLLRLVSIPGDQVGQTQIININNLPIL